MWTALLVLSLPLLSNRCQLSYRQGAHSELNLIKEGVFLVSDRLNVHMQHTQTVFFVCLLYFLT